MKLLDKGGKYECCRHWNSESQKNFHSPSPVHNLGSPNKMAKKSHSHDSCTVNPQMWSKAPCKTESEGLKGSGSLVEKPIHWRTLWYRNLMMNSIYSFLR